MTQEIYQKAIKFAGEKHKGQKVPGSKANYVVHLANVAMEILMAYTAEKNFDIDFAVQLALLHDSIEDTSATFKELETTFGTKVAKGVQALTKNEELPSKKEKMLDSLQRINALEKEVGMVKLADRITNLQAPPDFWKKEKINAYLQEAKTISQMLQNKNKYLNNRLEEKINTYKKYAE